MGIPRTRLIALMTVGIGLLVMAAAAVAARGWLRDQWMILQLRSGEPEEVRTAVEHLDRTRCLRAIPELLLSLERDFMFHWSKEHSLAWRITEVLVGFGPRGIEAFFGKGLERGKPVEINMLWEALELLDPGQKQNVIPIFLEALRDSDPDVRVRAIWLLDRLGPLAAPAFHDLTATLADKESNVRISAALFLGDEKVKSERLIPVLIEAVEDGWAGAHFGAIRILGELGPEAAPAVPALVKALNTKGNDQVGAARALGRIGPAARYAAPALEIAAATGRTEDLRAAAAEALRVMRMTIQGK